MHRRARVRLTASAAIVALGALCAACGSSGTDGGGPASSAATPGTGTTVPASSLPASTAPAAVGQGPWSVASFASTTGAFSWGVPVAAGSGAFSGLTLVDGTLIGAWADCAVDNVEQPMGVAAYDAATGARRWRTPALGFGEWVGDVFDWGRSVLGTGSSGAGGIYVATVWTTAEGRYGAPLRLVGLDTKTGAERWRLDVPSRTSRVDVSSDPVVIRDGTLLRAVDRRDGTTRWTATVPPETAISFVTPSAVVSTSPVLVAHDAATGRRRWAADATLDPAVAVGDVIIGLSTTTNRTLVAIDAATGAESWRRALARDTFSLVAAGGSVIVSGLVDESPRRIDVIDPKTGRSRWTQDGVFLVAGSEQVLAAPADLDGDPGTARASVLDLGTGTRTGAVDLARVPIVAEHQSGRRDLVTIPPLLEAGRLFTGRGCPHRG